MILFSFLFGCDSLGWFATKAVPTLEEVRPSWANPVDCDANRVPTVSSKRKCFQQRISCGVNSDPIIIEGTTKGGEKLLGDEFYQSAKCTPSRTYFFRNSPEAIYQLRVDADTKAEIQLDSNCADLDPFAISWTDSKCPTKAHASMIRECEMDNDLADGRLVLTTVSKPQTYLIGVDGKEGAAGNFRLTIKCSAYR